MSDEELGAVPFDLVRLLLGRRPHRALGALEALLRHARKRRVSDVRRTRDQDATLARHPSRTPLTPRRPGSGAAVVIDDPLGLRLSAVFSGVHNGYGGD